jgi:DNA polymerase-3 subunit chi
VTEVSFYHLYRRVEDALPRLLERVVASGQRAVVLAETDERVEALNSLLWTYSQDSFLPHGSARDGFAQEQPIFLTAAEENPNGATILVVVDERLPDFAAGFSRVLDMFNDSEPSKQAARERWRLYKGAGHAVTYWQQDEGGRWEKKA